MAGIVVVTGSVPGCVGLMQAAVTGSVSHSKSCSGNVAPPVSARTVMTSSKPTLTEAIEKAAMPLAVGIDRMPSLVDVAASATISGVGVVDAERSSVLIPGSVPAEPELLQSKFSVSSVGETAPPVVRYARRSG